MGRLFAEGTFVECIPNYAEREDGSGETIAAVERIAAGELGECFVVVLSSRCGIPESRVEDNSCCRDCKFAVNIECRTLRSRSDYVLYKLNLLKSTS